MVIFGLRPRQTLNMVLMSLMFVSMLRACFRFVPQCPFTLVNYRNLKYNYYCNIVLLITR